MGYGRLTPRAHITSNMRTRISMAPNYRYH
eukprot:SAG31_NODE_36768_length_310_cov_0.981043_1_plen_29_part_10